MYHDDKFVIVRTCGRDLQGRIKGLSTDCFISSSESREEIFEESCCKEVSEDKLYAVKSIQYIGSRKEVRLGSIPLSYIVD